VLALVTVDSDDSEPFSEPFLPKASFGAAEALIFQLVWLSRRIWQPKPSHLEREVAEFVAKSDFVPQFYRFDMLAGIAVQSLYPDAKEAFRQRLVDHMYGIHKRLLYWESKGNTDQSSPCYPASKEEHERWRPATVTDAEVISSSVQYQDASNEDIDVETIRRSDSSTFVTNEAGLPPPPTAEDDHICWYCRQAHTASEYEDEAWWR